MDVHEEEVLIDVSWAESPEGWAATLLTATDGELIERPLHPGDEIEFEVTDTRRCVGYAGDDGQHHLCPDFEAIDEGTQCYRCRKRDVHRDYIEGRTGEMRDGDHSVYLAQCGDTVKVGVTRSRRVMKRWVEQGAAYAVEIDSGLSATDALVREEEISNAGLTERIRKESKVPVPGEHRLADVMDEYGVNGEVVNVLSRTVYPRTTAGTVQRDDRVAGGVQSVLGKLIEVPGQCFAVTSGRCIGPAEQRGLADFA